MKKNLQSQIQKCNDKWMLVAPFCVLLYCKSGTLVLLIFQIKKYFTKTKKRTVSCNSAKNRDNLGQYCGIVN